MAVRAVGGHRSRPGVARIRLATTAVLAAAAVSACGTSGKVWGPQGVNATPLSARKPVVSLEGEDADAKSKVTYRKPVHLSVTDGSFSEVTLSSDQGDDLTGTVTEDGASWVSTTPPRPDRSYQGAVEVKDTKGAARVLNVSFSVSAVPSSRRLSFTVSPRSGTTVGIGQPIKVRFTTTITQRAAVEKAMTVQAKAPSGTTVTGSWHWLNGKEVHWRPKTFWETGTKVALSMRIAGVKAAKNVYGRKDYSQKFSIGPSRIAKIDGKTHRIRIYHDGKLVDDWPTGTGKRGLETYSGTYVVLGKAKEVVMDSCSARITCDEENPEFYSMKQYWATRITASGTFLHAASWDPVIGKANVSHGCIHLTDAHAEEYFDTAEIGDVVIVSNTGRGPQERIATQDPGLYDWNLTWEQWTAGSALK